MLFFEIKLCLNKLTKNVLTKNVSRNHLLIFKIKILFIQLLVLTISKKCNFSFFFRLLSNMKLLHVIFFLPFLTSSIRVSGKDDPDTILEKLLYKYRKKLPVMNSPLKVAVRLHIIGLQLDPSNNEMTVEMFLGQRWKDKQLQWSTDTFFGNSLDISSLKEKIWLPDLIFSNGKKSFLHSLAQPNFYLSLQRDGSVTFIQMLSQSFRCALRSDWNFPMDSAVCEMKLESLRHLATDMEILWDVRPVVVDQLDFREFSQPKVETNATTVFTTTGTYKKIVAKLDFGRRWLLPYFFNVYLPTVLLLVTAYFAFWIEPEAVFARLLLTCIPLSVLCSMCHRGAEGDLLQMWLFFCASFLFLLLLVIVALHVFWTYNNEKDTNHRRGARKNLKFAHRITEIVFGRICMPIIVVLFNAYYWTLLPKEQGSK